jgi:hypothetical protein
VTDRSGGRSARPFGLFTPSSPRPGETILTYRNFQGRVLRNITSVADSLDRALRRGERSVVVADTSLVWSHLPPTTTVRLGTLDGLISSGRLGIIQDRRLRSALGAWGNELAELSEEEITLRELAYGDLDRVLRVRVNTWDLWTKGDSVFFGTLSPESQARVRRIPADTEILGIFSVRYSILSHAMDEFDTLMEEVDSILALVEQSL